jgi:Tfp pilus assembly protein PilF
MRRYPDYFKTLNPFFSSPDVQASTKSMYIGNLTRSLDPRILEIHRAGFDSLALKAAAAHPSDSTMLSTVGTYFYATGREKEAGEWFRKSADLFPDSFMQAATYIQYLQLQSRWEELRQRADDGYRRFGQLAFLDYANLASYNLEDWDSIIGTSQMLLKAFPKDKDICLNAWTQLGDAYHSKGDSKSSFKAYEKALKINPNYAPVLNNYAYYLSVEGKQLKKAYNMSKKTIEQEPDNATYLDTFAWILHLMGKDLEAKPFFKHAMLYGGKESAVILRHYATVLEALGEADTAKIYRNQAKRLDDAGKQ